MEGYVLWDDGSGGGVGMVCKQARKDAGMKQGMEAGDQARLGMY